MEIEAASTLVDCPTCGRPMRVPMEFLEREVQCAHCGCNSVVTLKEIVRERFSREQNNRIRWILSDR